MKQASHPTSKLVGRLVNKVTNFSQLQSSVQGGKTQAHFLLTKGTYVEPYLAQYGQRSNGGCSEDKVLPYLSSGPLIPKSANIYPEKPI